MKVRPKRNVVVQKLQQCVTLFLLISHNVTSDCLLSMAGLLELLPLHLHCGLTKSAFSPVVGWVLTIGCSLVTGSLRTIPPLALAASACSIPECTALSPCSRSRKLGLNLRYASAISAKIVLESLAFPMTPDHTGSVTTYSPPVDGLSKMYRIVVPGG